jgi:endonuclease YncB( thermonuclease family)
MVAKTVALAVVVIGALAAIFYGGISLSYADEMPRMEMCSGPVRVNCVVDGDTFWLNGEKIRISDIDTPEISKADCPEELRLAADATAMLINLLNGRCNGAAKIDLNALWQ